MIRQGIKQYANWPTIPQLYVNGEFIGGSDIMREMYESGELQQLLTQQTSTSQLLALAKEVEMPRLLGHATVAKTTARSKRNSAVVGAFLGLLLGLLAALLWDRFAPAVARRPGL